MAWGSDSLEAPALLPHPLTPSAKSHTITLVSTRPCRSPLLYIFLSADLSIVRPRTHVVIMPLTFEPGHCWHTLFFSAHCACRSSHQISREWGEWDEMWGGGFSHSCTCVCTRTYTRVRPCDGSRKLPLSGPEERGCVPCLSLFRPRPPASFACSVCMCVLHVYLSVRASVSLRLRSPTHAWWSVCRCTISGPIDR